MITSKGYWIPDAVTADVVMLIKHVSENPLVVLITRGQDPYKNLQAFPGGHMDENDETIEDAAIREVFEETKIVIEKENLNLIGVYSKKDRDPRGRYIDIAYYVWIDYKDYRGCRPGDDAKRVGLDTLKHAIEFDNLAFDHKEILKDVQKMLYKKSSYTKFIDYVKQKIGGGN